MIIRNFDVVALDDMATRFACQREVDDGVFETIGNFDNQESANELCDLLNEDIEAENESLEDALARAYGVSA